MNGGDSATKVPGVENQQLERELRQALQDLETRNGELEHALHDLRKTQGELLKADKMASVGRLAAGVAHEINTPIQFVGDNVRACEENFTELHELVEEYRRLLSDLDEKGIFRDRVAKLRLREEQIDRFGAAVMPLLADLITP